MAELKKEDMIKTIEESIEKIKSKDFNVFFLRLESSIKMFLHILYMQVLLKNTLYIQVEDLLYYKV